jgi:hypothetical protein
MAAMIRMSEEDLNALRAAAATLEHPGLAARLGNIAGKPIELVGRALPEAASEAVATATTKALHAALAVALRTMEKEPKAASRLLHKALAAASGAVGGGFGLAALPVELPISTIIMLRSIGDIARSEGEDLADPESALACLQVFALGTRDGETNAAESGYFAARGLLAKSVAEAARFIAERGVVAVGASPNAFVVPAQSDIKTMPELIDKAKASPGKLNWTSPGAGTTPYLAGEVLKLRTGINILHIPFAGAGPATTAVLAGQVDLYTANIGSLMALIDAGKVRPIAVTSRERWPDLPNVPSLEELGVKDAVDHTWH